MKNCALVHSKTASHCRFGSIFVIFCCIVFSDMHTFLLVKCVKKSTSQITRHSSCEVYFKMYACERIMPCGLGMYQVTIFFRNAY